MIRKIGHYSNIDEDGYIIPDVAFDKIPTHWQSLIAEIVSFTENRKDKDITSLYVRGSVPRGLAIDSVSDLDLIFLSKNEIKKHPDIIVRFRKELLKLFPFCNGIEWSIEPVSELDDIRPPQDISPLSVRLKTQSLYLWGTDVTRAIPRIKPGVNMLSHVFVFQKDWAYYPQQISNANSQKRIDELSLWMGKRILRTMFELSMLQMPRFTRDLYFCYERAADIYPEIKIELYKVLELILKANVQPENIISVYNSVADFAIDKIKEAGLLNFCVSP